MTAARKAKPKPNAKRPRGRPSTFDESLIPAIQARAEEGATNREIAEFLGVHEAQLWRWAQANPVLRSALKLGKEAADQRVEASLYRRATGYSFDAVKIVADAKTGDVLQIPYVEHVAPDTTAAIFWLKNRRPAEWRDRVEHNHGGEVTQRFVIEIAPPQPDAVLDLKPANALPAE